MKSLLIITFSLFTLSNIVTAQSVITDTFDVKIKLFRDTFDFNEGIIIRLDLTNNTSKIKKIEIDTTQDWGPAYARISVINVKTKKSVIEVPNKSMMISQLDPSPRRVIRLYTLNPNEFVRYWFSLKDMAMLNTIDNTLKRGNYEMQINYLGNLSNKILFIVK